MIKYLFKKRKLHSIIQYSQMKFSLISLLLILDFKIQIKLENKQLFLLIYFLNNLEMENMNQNIQIMRNILIHYLFIELNELYDFEENMINVHVKRSYPKELNPFNNS